MNPYYKDYREYLSEIFPGRRLQKISLNAGFSCPNRDGTISRGGCIYCLNQSFTPSYCFEADNSVTTQIDKGIAFFRKKYPDTLYLSYFQSYTNTHADPRLLEDLFRQASAHPKVAGLIVGTRPDCLPTTTLEILERLNQEKPVFVELGAETSFDATLRTINRGHSWQTTTEAVKELTSRGLRVGLHLIAGLPGEGPDEVMETHLRVCRLPIESLKYHQLQVLRGTPLEQMAAGGLKLHTFTLEEYMELCCRIVMSTPRHICLERFLASAPPELVISPRWGLKNYEFTNRLLQELHNRYGSAATSNQKK